MPAAPPEPAAPTPVCALPPRYWWLKRICALTLAWIAFLVAVRLWWGWEADRRWEATIARYRAAGQPVFRADFAATPIPDEENAATYLRAAIEIMRSTGLPASIDQPFGDGPAARPVSDEDMAQRHAAEQRILELVRRARACEHANWDLSNEELVGKDLPGLRKLCQTVAGLLDYEACRGNVAGVIEHAQDLMALCGQASVMAPDIIGGLVRTALHELLCDRLGNALPVVRGGLASHAGESAHVPASRAQITVLMNSLLDERGWQDRWKRDMHGERMQLLETAAGLRENKLGRSVSRYGLPTVPAHARWPVLLVGPMWTLDGLRAAEVATTLGDALTACNLAEADRLLPPALEVISAIEGLSCSLSADVRSQTMQYMLVLSFREVAQRRMTATALAICLYEADHGRRPARLADLVPDYLPAIPADPFSPDDRPICYLPNDDLPRLYSVGLNGVDDGGRYEFTVSKISRDSLDYPLFFLDGRPTPPAWPPSLQAVPDEQQPGDAG
jgi:hypothetical protein